MQVNVFTSDIMKNNDTHLSLKILFKSLEVFYSHFVL